jgi:hypothetical protein
MQGGARVLPIQEGWFTAQGQAPGRGPQSPGRPVRPASWGAWIGGVNTAHLRFRPFGGEDSGAEEPAAPHIRVQPQHS